MHGCAARSCGGSDDSCVTTREAEGPGEHSRFVPAKSGHRMTEWEVSEHFVEHQTWKEPAFSRGCPRGLAFVLSGREFNTCSKSSSGYAPILWDAAWDSGAKKSRGFIVNLAAHPRSETFRSRVCCERCLTQRRKDAKDELAEKCG